MKEAPDNFSKRIVRWSQFRTFSALAFYLFTPGALPQAIPFRAFGAVNP